MQRERVCTFAKKFRDYGIKVILDQFYLDENPGGPNDGWDKWSSDRALKTENVLIVGTESWFQCFEKAQKPGTGLGAACEADDLRHRIYEAGGVINNIRVVIFDDNDVKHVPAKLKRYHRFHADRDFANIVQWLGGTLPANSCPHPPETSIPHNLPALNPFFGREDELKQIAEALKPKHHGWGVLIDGPGGMGKTSLAVRAAYDASPNDFKKIVFISLKTRELDDDGVRELSGFILSGLVELFSELARELKCDTIAKTPEHQRPRFLLDAMRGTQTLLILDNLESLLKSERDILITFVKKLPRGCKAILTSRGRIGSGSEELTLEKLDQDSVLATLAELANHNSLLAKTNKAERIALYKQTAGRPLLLRWTAGQLGRGNCRTFTDALRFLRSCPKDNDPLEFIFGDLTGEFTPKEMRVLSALTYFSLPATTAHIAEVAGVVKEQVEAALCALANRSLVIPHQEKQVFVLVPTVADFLRRAHPAVVREIGNQLEERAYTLITTNGNIRHDLFPVLDAAWPIVAPALTLLLEGPNERLQTVCRSLYKFLNFTGRWDEWLSLSRQAETKSAGDGDHINAGWRAYHAGWVHRLRSEGDAVLICANRAAAHWEVAPTDTNRRAYAIRLRALGHRLNRNYSAAIAASKEALDIWRTISTESEQVAIALNDLAASEQLAGKVSASKHHAHEALRVARAVGYEEGVSYITGNLSGRAIDDGDMSAATTLARKALSIAKKLGRQELIASNSARLAIALARQGKHADGLRHARHAVEIYTKLRSPNLTHANAALQECTPRTTKRRNKASPSSKKRTRR